MPGLGPQLQRQKTLEALLSWVLALGEMQPLVLEVEDLHWADPSTLEWLGLLAEQCATAGILLLLSYRPEFEPPWAHREHVLPIALTRLRPRDARELASAALSESALPEAIVEQIASRSDGIPLFVEELARGVVEAALDPGGSLSDLEIPETLQDSLMARLDNLGEAKQVAQLGAVVGREFGYALIESVAPVPEAALREGLGRLVEAELLYQRGLPPQATYSFKHALVQDTAYDSLLGSQRRELHGRIADVLGERFGERVAREPELLARHLQQAGRTEAAIAQYERAAQQATQRFAQSEALAHLREALALVTRLPESAVRDEREVRLQIAFGSAIFAVRGGWDPEAERAYLRARVLCAGSESPASVRALLGLSLFHFSRSEVLASLELAEQALALAEGASDVYPRVVAHTRLGWCRCFLGEIRIAHDHLKRAVALDGLGEHRGVASAWGQDWGLAARGLGAHLTLSLGYPERARTEMEQMLALARAADPYSLAFALAILAMFHRRLGERSLALEAAAEAIGIAEEHGFPIVLLLAGATHGWARGGAKGLQELESAARQARANRSPGTGDYMIPLARAWLDCGSTEEALRAVRIGLEEAGEIECYKPELRHLEGAIHFRRGAFEEAERVLREAVGIARGMEAKTLELAAATTLARLLRDRGRRDEARALLRPVYDWFTEGFDTRDLQEARAVLDALG